MGGKACIRGLRVTMAMVVRRTAGGASRAEMIVDFPYVEPKDVTHALLCAVRQQSSQHTEHI